MKKNVLEWTVFAVSAALILGCAALLVYQQISGGRAAPSIAVVTGEIRQTAGGFAVAVEVRNTGDTSAEEVGIEALLSSAGGHERAETTLAYVPYHSVRRAWLVFARDPREGQLTARVLGYREP
jgi:uncharacterized protein (TIGR02588 family)